MGIRAEVRCATVAIAVLLLLSGGAAGEAVRGGLSPGSAGSGAGSGSALQLPAALLTPWSVRAGFIPAWTSEVSQLAPYSGPLTVSLSFWPRDPMMFSSAALGPAPLGPATFAARYGADPAAYEAVESYLLSHGFRILHSFPDRLALTVTGPASASPATFGTSIAQGIFHGRSVHFPTAVPTLPASLQPYVSSLSGLSEGFTQFTLPLHALPLVRSPSSPVTPAQGRTTSLVTPTSVHAIYDLDSLYNYSGTLHLATGVGIALVLWGQGYDPTDLSTFFAQDYPSEFTAPTVTAVPVDGAPGPSASAVSDPSQAPLELTLDLEWAGTQAPGASLYAVYAPDGPASNQYSPSDVSLEDALNRAIQQPGVDVVSMSFATPDGSDGAFQAAFTTAFQSALVQGITPVAASGDNGGTDNAKGACTATPQPDFPAASPDVLAVGGTAPVLSLSLTGAVTGLDSEPAWKDSGGGFSVDYSAPSWQLVGSARSVISPSGHRGIPDVAGPAAYNFLYFGGQNGAGNGTSFAAPTWAGILAEMDAVRGGALTQLVPRLYTIGAAEEKGTAAIGLADITSGNNCLGPATTGWDTATGWGSPRAGLLYQDLSGSYVSVGLSLSASTVAPGGGFTATVTVQNVTSHAPYAAITVNLSVSAQGYTGPCGGTLSTGSGLTDANGTTVVSLSVPACYLGTRATVAATVQQGKLFGGSSMSLAVNLLGIAGFLAFIQTFPYNVIAFALIMLVAAFVGLALGNRQRRRSRASRVPPPTAGPETARSAPQAAPDASPSAPGPGAIEAEPAEMAEGSPEGARTESEASAGPTPAATSPASVECAVCHFSYDPSYGFCPRCGQYLPGHEPGGPGGPYS